MADEILRRLERQLAQNGDDEAWFKVQARRRLLGLPYEEARISGTENNMSLYQNDWIRPDHGSIGLITRFNNGWRVETWWDDNEWDNYGLHPGEPISWTTITYDEDDDNVANAIYCSTVDCATKCHQRRVSAVVDGTIHYE